MKHVEDSEEDEIRELTEESEIKVHEKQVEDNEDEDSIEEEDGSDLEIIIKVEEETKFDISKIVVFHLDDNNEVSSVREIEFVGSLKIGRTVPRDSENERPKDALFESRVMSRNHSSICFKNGNFFIQDLNSSNGTFVNSFSIDPMTEEQIFSDDLLQFGTKVGLHEPVKVKIELFNPDGEKSKQRKKTDEGVEKISEEDLKDLKRILDETELNEVAVKNKLTALENIIKEFKNINEENSFEKQMIEKITNIETTLMSLKLLETSQMKNREDINLSIRMILIDVIQEIILDNSMDDKVQKQFFLAIINKLKDHADDPLFEEYNVVIRKSGTLQKTPEIASPIVFYQDDEIEGMEPRNSYEEKNEESEPRESIYLSTPRGILKSPNSPRNSAKLIRINVIPEVREIENCLEDKFCIDLTGLLPPSTVQRRKPTESVSEQNQEKFVSSPKRRSWSKKKDESVQFDPRDLRSRLNQISSIDEAVEIPDKESTENDLKDEEITDHEKEVLFDRKLKEIQNQLEQTKTENEEHFEKTQNGIQEVQDRVTEVHGAINRIFTQFVFTIQGFFFMFVIGIILLGLGFKKNPTVLDYW